MALHLNMLSSYKTPNQALQPTADRLENLHMRAPTLKVAAWLAPVSGG